MLGVGVCVLFVYIDTVVLHLNFSHTKLRIEIGGKMSEKISLDGSESRDSQQSFENNTDTNYSENESTEDGSTESDGKSERSHTDYYSNSTNSDDITIPKIERVITTKDKDFMHYANKNADIDGCGGDGSGGGGDDNCAAQKRVPLKRTFCKFCVQVLHLNVEHAH